MATVIAELTICTDCALTHANGEVPADTRVTPWALLPAADVALGDERGFETTPCDACGTDLAGDRWDASVFGWSRHLTPQCGNAQHAVSEDGQSATCVHCGQSWAAHAAEGPNDSQCPAQHSACWASVPLQAGETVPCGCSCHPAPYVPSITLQGVDGQTYALRVVE